MACGRAEHVNKIDGRKCQAKFITSTSIIISAFKRKCWAPRPTQYAYLRPNFNRNVNGDKSYSIHTVFIILGKCHIYCGYEDRGFYLSYTVKKTEKELQKKKKNNHNC